MQEKTVRQNRHLKVGDNIEEPNEIRIVVAINQQPVTAIVDTGCTQTIMDSRVADQLEIVRQPCSASIQLGRENANIQAEGKATGLQIQHGPHQLNDVTMTIARLPEEIIYLGMDLLSKLGIGLTGI